MKNVRNTLATLAMMTVLAVGTTFAGILVSDFNGGSKSDPCTTTTVKTDKTDWGIIINSAGGIIINSLTGILVSDFGGILVSDFGKDDAPVNCGIIINS